MKIFILTLLFTTLSIDISYGFAGLLTRNRTRHHNNGKHSGAYTKLNETSKINKIKKLLNFTPSKKSCLKRLRTRRNKKIFKFGFNTGFRVIVPLLLLDTKDVRKSAVKSVRSIINLKLIKSARNYIQAAESKDHNSRSFKRAQARFERNWPKKANEINDHLPSREELKGKEIIVKKEWAQQIVHYSNNITECEKLTKNGLLDEIANTTKQDGPRSLTSKKFKSNTTLRLPFSSTKAE